MSIHEAYMSIQEAYMSIHETFINIPICRPECPRDFEEADHEQCSLHIHPHTAPTHYQVLQMPKCQCL